MSQNPHNRGVDDHSNQFGTAYVMVACYIDCSMSPQGFFYAEIVQRGGGAATCGPVARTSSKLFPMGFSSQYNSTSSSIRNK